MQGTHFALNIWTMDGLKVVTYYTLEANHEIDTRKGVRFAIE